MEFKIARESGKSTADQELAAEAASTGKVQSPGPMKAILKHEDFSKHC